MKLPAGFCWLTVVVMVLVLVFALELEEVCISTITTAEAEIISTTMMAATAGPIPPLFTRSFVVATIMKYAQKRDNAK
jgi:hypothetical protein